MYEDYDVFAELDTFCSSSKLPEKLPDFPQDEAVHIPPESPPETPKPEKAKPKGRTRKKAQKTIQKQIIEILEGSNCTPPSKRTRKSRTPKQKTKKQTTVGKAANIIETIDLVSSPMIPTESIAIDSDDEDSRMRSQLQAVSLDTSYENPEISIKINWKGETEVYKLRKYQKFKQIFKTIAERENANLEDLVFNINNKIIDADDSPASIDYKIFQFICGRVVISQNKGNRNEVYKKKDPNQVSLKIQSDRWRRPFIIKINRTDTFEILYIKCSEECKMSCNDFKLFFDGELLKVTETPNDIQLDGGEIIDCTFKK